MSRGRTKLLRIEEVEEIPASHLRKPKSKSKYFPYLREMAQKPKGSLLKVNNGHVGASTLYSNLTAVCEKAKIRNLDFYIRGKKVYCEVK